MLLAVVATPGAARLGPHRQQLIALDRRNSDARGIWFDGAGLRECEFSKTGIERLRPGDPRPLRLNDNALTGGIPAEFGDPGCRITE